MRDSLEERLAEQLGTLGEAVDDELPPPVDLEFQVLRRRRRTRATRRGVALAVAAAIVTALATVATVHGTTGRRDTLHVAASSTTAVPVHDALQPGTVMLSARGQYVVSLDATGKRNATMLSVEHGEVKYARATDDHREIWYLSLKRGIRACGDVVREDVDAGTTKIVAHAVTFDVSPDGSRLALYGAGDLAHDQCVPVSPTRSGRIVVLDVAGASSSAPLPVGSVSSMRWAPDGSYLVSVSCSSDTCSGYDVIDVAADGALLARSGALSTSPSRLVHSASIEFGPSGLFALEQTTPFPNQSAPRRPTVRVGRLDPRAPGTSEVVFSTGTNWDVSQVVPTSAGTYVVAAPVKAGATTASPADAGLYRISGGRLALVRPLPDPGTLTPVTPLP
jgi:hypothetical protein